MRILNYDIVYVVINNKSVKIFKVQNDDGFFAIKLVNLESSDANFSNYRIDLNHRNIVKCYDIIESFAFEHGMYKLFILEWLDGDTLREHIHRQEDFDIKHYIQILNGISFLHSLNIMHGDIKPENIIMSINSQKTIIPKIIDYDSQFVIMSSKKIATVQYAHPYYGSVLLKEEDLWAIGCLTYEMITKKVLFNGDKETIIKRQISIKDIIHLPEPYRYICYLCLRFNLDNVKVLEVNTILRILSTKNKIGLKFRILRTYLFS